MTPDREFDWENTGQQRPGEHWRFYEIATKEILGWISSPGIEFDIFTATRQTCDRGVVIGLYISLEGAKRAVERYYGVAPDGTRSRAGMAIK